PRASRARRMKGPWGQGERRRLFLWEGTKKARRSWDLSRISRSARLVSVVGEPAPGQALADLLEPIADAAEAWGLGLTEVAQLLVVTGLRLAEVVVNHAQLLPFLAERSRAGLGEVAPLADGAPLAEPERPVLVP